MNRWIIGCGTVVVVLISCGGEPSAPPLASPDERVFIDVTGDWLLSGVAYPIASTGEEGRCDLTPIAVSLERFSMGPLFEALWGYGVEGSYEAGSFACDDEATAWAVARGLIMPSDTAIPLPAGDIRNGVTKTTCVDTFPCASGQNLSMWFGSHPVGQNVWPSNAFFRAGSFPRPSDFPTWPQTVTPSQLAGDFIYYDDAGPAMYGPWSAVRP